MTVKPFSQELYNADDNAKDIWIDFLNSLSWKAWVNPDKYGIDVLAINKHGESHNFEVEVKHNWVGDHFQYKTLHYSYRKSKFLNSSDKISFVTFNHDRTHVLIVPNRVLANAKIITKDTIYTKAEQFIEVQVDDCVLVKLSGYQE